MTDGTVAMRRYYYSLKPFREVFRTGVPVLTYHKLGPSPRGVRLRKLYAGADLFARQLAELREAGYKTIALGQVRGAWSNPQQRLALTFDDGFYNVLQHALPVLAANGFCATQFLVAGLLGRANEWELRESEARELLMDEAQVREWLAAGQCIGSHSCTHPRLTRIPLGEARREIADSKKALEDRFGVAVEHFCYPYGDWNEAVRDAVAEAGYRTACTTDVGINRPGLSPFALKRLSARYIPRTLKTLLHRFGG
ncbi:MAG: polysaccharide deacetylase family protein [Verrucomicrobia bacterium]|nr:polysaccharide deacetylase family protein [Verrucomicrobiota bacterium]